MEAGEEVWAGIRSFYISLPLAEAEINSLKMISWVISNPGLFIDGGSFDLDGPMSGRFHTVSSGLRVIGERPSGIPTFSGP